MLPDLQSEHNQGIAVDKAVQARDAVIHVRLLAIN